MPVVVPDVVMDDSSESTPSYPEEETFDLSPQQRSSVNLAYHRGMSEDEQVLIRRDREREGRCGDCGMQTYQWTWNPLIQTQIKLPLTIPHEVHRGRCLLCHPLPAQTTQSHQKQHSHSFPPATLKSPASARRRISDYGCKGLGEEGLDSEERDDPHVRIAMHAMERADICDVLHVMKCVPHIGLLQDRGCERLWILSWDDDNATSIGRIGGIPLILRAMARFPHIVHLQLCACEALQNLAAHESNRREIAESGGIAMIVQAMMRHSKSPEIQQCACMALASLAFEYPQDICRVGGLHAVLYAAKHFHQEIRVMRAAYEAIQSMGVDPQGRLSVLSNASD